MSAGFQSGFAWLTARHGWASNFYAVCFLGRNERDNASGIGSRSSYLLNGSHSTVRANSGHVELSFRKCEKSTVRLYVRHSYVRVQTMVGTGPFVFSLGSSVRHCSINRKVEDTEQQVRLFEHGRRRHLPFLCAAVICTHGLGVNF